MVFYGSFNSENTNVTGVANVGAIFGACYGNENAYIRHQMQVDSCTVIGTGNYLGGISGYHHGGNNLGWKVIDTTISANNTSSKNVGGLVGYLGQTPIDRIQIDGITIKGNATNVGGAVGTNDSRTWITLGYITNAIIEGNSNVGGVYGYSSASYIHDLYIDAEIKAHSSSAGGVIGYMDNTYMEESRNIIQIYRVAVVNSNIVAESKAGGLIGDIATNIFRNKSFYYDNYVETNVTSTNSSTGSLIIGGRPDENDYIDNTYVYKYSKLNSNYVYATNDNINNNQYLVRTDLDNQSTYSNKINLGTTFWSYTSLSEGKYPKINDDYVYHPELQTGVNLPVDPEIADISLLSEGNESDTTSQNEETDIKIQNSTVIDALPSYKVYPISVNEINIDFSEVMNNYKVEENNGQQGEQLRSADTKTYFTYYVNGEEKETIELSNTTKQTYTFKYNFKDTLEIKLTREDNVDLNNVMENTQTNLTSDESASTKTNMETNAETGTKTNIYTETIVIKPEDVRSEASLVGRNNAYILGTNIYVNGELQQGEYVNVYEGLALKSDGTVINIATNEIVEQNVETVLEENTKPLETYNYKDYRINTYGTYSTVNGNIKLQIYNVRSGKFSVLSNGLDIKIGNSIIDNYNNKEYQTILSTEGNLVDLKEMLKYPENFLTRNIKQIAQNTDEEKTEMIVLYNTGKVIVFNYVTGEVIYENNEKADSGLVDYLEGSISNIWNNYEEKQQEYAKSKELEQKLAKLPIEEALKEIMDSSTDDTNGVSRNPNKLEENNNTANKDIAQGTTSGNEDRNSGNNSNTSTDNSYVSVYNAETKEYEVYSENEILNESGETPVSETEKIKQNGLEGIYGYNAKEETKPQTNGAIIVIATIVIAVIALVILRKIVVKNNTKKKK